MEHNNLAYHKGPVTPPGSDGSPFLGLADGRRQKPLEGSSPNSNSSGMGFVARVFSLLPIRWIGSTDGLKSPHPSRLDKIVETKNSKIYFHEKLQHHEVDRKNLNIKEKKDKRTKPIWFLIGPVSSSKRTSSISDCLDFFVGGCGGGVGLRVALDQVSDGQIIDDLLHFLHVVLQRVELLPQPVVLEVEKTKAGLRTKKPKSKVSHAAKGMSRKNLHFIEKMPKMKAKTSRVSFIKWWHISERVSLNKRDP